MSNVGRFVGIRDDRHPVGEHVFSLADVEAGRTREFGNASRGAYLLPCQFRVHVEVAPHIDDEAVVLWGSGSPRREFMHVDDMAEACLVVMDRHDGNELINVGTGVDVTIKELAEIVRTTVGFTGRIDWDTSRPDGTPRKLMDVSHLRNLGWQARTRLEDGIALAYQDFLARHP